MQLYKVGLTFYMNDSEVDKFKELIMDESCRATDWASESNHIDYDIDRCAVRCVRYDVYFESMEEAQGFISDVRKVFKEQ